MQNFTGGIRDKRKILQAAGGERSVAGCVVVIVRFFAVEHAVLRTECRDLFEGFAQFFKHHFLIHGDTRDGWCRKRAGPWFEFACLPFLFAGVNDDFKLHAAAMNRRGVTKLSFC